MLLASLASAADPGDAFDCPVMTTPADGLRFADPGEISEALSDAIAEWVLAQYEVGCPVSCEHEDDCAYVDDCVTSVGTHIVVDYSRYESGLSFTEAWDVAVGTTDGATLTLTFDQHYTYPWPSPYDSDDRTWSAGGPG